jgi:16S rRNA (guanine(527)-N(7))-methyltransferase RsmG
VQDMLARFAGEVRRWSSRTHLVGKSNIEENIMISLLDSLHLLRFTERSGDLERENGSRSEVADIGSGAGFPGIVWAIARPDIDLTLFERREKPRLFLERTVTLLGLEGVVSVGGEAKESERAGRYDLVISKAAGRLDAIVPMAVELLSPGGAYLTIKGEGWKDELSGAAEGPMNLATSKKLPGGRGAMLRFRRIGR